MFIKNTNWNNDLKNCTNTQCVLSRLKMGCLYSKNATFVPPYDKTL